MSKLTKRQRERLTSIVERGGFYTSKTDEGLLTRKLITTWRETTGYGRYLVAATDAGRAALAPTPITEA